MSFKVGDRVCSPNGDIGSIMRIFRFSDTYKVKWDNNRDLFTVVTGYYLTKINGLERVLKELDD